MSETDSLSIDSGRFQTNRYPGFASGRLTPSGNLAPVSSREIGGLAPGDTAVAGGRKPSAIDQFSAEPPAIEKPSLGDVAKGFAPSIGQYGGQKLGQEYGSKLLGEWAGRSAPSLLGETGKTAGAAAGGYGGGAAGTTASSASATAASTEAAKSQLSWGGVAGAGIGSAIGTYIATGDTDQSAKVGVGTAVGTYVGNALVPGVGGFVGGFIGGAIGGSCYITTAVCELDGKPDDCEELTVMRAWRDDVLRGNPVGNALIDVYYRVAPAALAVIRERPDAAEYLAALRDDYILPTVNNLKAGNNPLALALYTAMIFKVAGETAQEAGLTIVNKSTTKVSPIDRAVHDDEIIAAARNALSPEEMRRFCTAMDPDLLPIIEKLFGERAAYCIGLFAREYDRNRISLH